MLDNFMNLPDYHVHPDFSFDAKGTIDEFCETAIKKGLTEICFTTHYDTDPRLPEHHRTILILREFEGFDYQSIADMLHVKKGTVRSRLARAGGSLRQELKSYLIANPTSKPVTGVALPV